MGIKRFNKTDLTSERLVALVEELKREAQYGNFKNIQDFAKSFSANIVKEQFQIVDGKRTFKVGDEEIDFDEAISKIYNAIENNVKGQRLGTTEKIEYDQMWDAINEQMTSLFKQKEMMEELVDRGFSLDDFKNKAERADQLSDERIGKYTAKIDALKAERNAVLGEDYVDQDPLLSQKSLKTKLQEEKDATEGLKDIERMITEISDLENSTKAMKDAIRNDPSKEALYKDSIETNRADVKALSSDLKAKIKEVKDLKLPGFDNGKLDDCEKQDRTVATTAVTDLISSMDARKNIIYTKVADNLLAYVADPENKKTLDSAEQAKIEAIKTGTTPTDAQWKAAKDILNKYMNSMDKDITSMERSKRTEQFLKDERKRGVDKYAEIEQKIQEFENGFRKVQGRNEEGQLLYRTEDGRGVTTEDTGVPFLQYEPNEEKVEEYLADFDNDYEIETAENKVIESWEGKSWRERREILKEAGIGNPFTRLFRAAFRVDKTLMEGEVDKIVEGKKQEHIENKMTEDPLVEAAGLEIELQNMHDTIKKSAKMHESMQYGAYAVTNKKGTKDDIVNALEDASYDELALRIARLTGTESQKNKLDQARKTSYTQKMVNQRHLNNSGAKVEKPAKSPKFKEDDEGR